jgi:DNA-binding transcriptional regulator GbsR (MarR family)
LNKLNLLVQIKLMLVPLVEKEPSPTGPDRPPATQLTPLETEIIDFFVQLSRVLGQPRSLAEIYGLLFISGRPLAMDDLIERLQLSKGSASQGLKFLCSIGAARTVYVAGERRTHYEAVAELRNLATRFLRDQIVPHLDNGQARLERIADMVRQLPLAERARINGRVKMLQSWERQGRRFLPLVVKILGH